MQVASLHALYDATLQRQMGVMINAITPKTTGSIAWYWAWSGQVLSCDQTRGKPFPRYLAGETWPNQTKPEPERGLRPTRGLGFPPPPLGASYLQL